MGKNRYFGLKENSNYYKHEMCQHFKNDFLPTA